MPHRALFVALMLLTLTGCRLPEDEWGVVRVVWNDFPWWSVAWRLAFWTILGAAIGLIVGIATSLLFRRYGAYRLPWPRMRWWLQFAIITLNIIAMPILFGAIGLFEGVYRSGEVAVRHSAIGKELLPKLAAEGADLVVLLDRLLENEEINAEDWQAIRGKKHPVNMPRLLDRLDRIQEGAADRITQKLKEKLVEHNPELKGGVGETVADWTLPLLLKYLLNRKLHGKLKEIGVPDILEEARAEATKDGDDLMTHAELTAFLTDRVLIRMLLYPFRKWVTNVQQLALGIIAAWFATPVVLMFITRWIAFWWKRREARRLCVDRV